MDFDQFKGVGDKILRRHEVAKQLKIHSEPFELIEALVDLHYKDGKSSLERVGLSTFGMPLVGTGDIGAELRITEDKEGHGDKKKYLLKIRTHSKITGAVSLTPLCEVGSEATVESYDLRPIKPTAEHPATSLDTQTKALAIIAIREAAFVQDVGLIPKDHHEILNDYEELPAS